MAKASLSEFGSYRAHFISFYNWQKTLRYSSSIFIWTNKIHIQYSNHVRYKPALLVSSCHDMNLAWKGQEYYFGNIRILSVKDLNMFPTECWTDSFTLCLNVQIHLITKNYIQPSTHLFSFSIEHNWHSQQSTSLIQGHSKRPPVLIQLVCESFYEFWGIVLTVHQPLGYRHDVIDVNIHALVKNSKHGIL